MDTKVLIHTLEELEIDEFYLIENKSYNTSRIVQFTGIEERRLEYRLGYRIARFNIISSTNEEIPVGMNIRLNFDYNIRENRSIYKI